MLSPDSQPVHRIAARHVVSAAGLSRSRWAPRLDGPKGSLAVRTDHPNSSHGHKVAHNYLEGPSSSGEINVLRRSSTECYEISIFLLQLDGSLKRFEPDILLAGLGPNNCGHVCFG
jgi:hypothetical protein